MTYFPTFAFCPPSQKWAVLQAAGVEPLTCPPYHYSPSPPSPSPSPPSTRPREAKSPVQGRGAGGGLPFDPGSLRNRALLYFSLHGIPNQPYWYGADHVTAMSTDAFQNLDLSNTIVFVANCHLAETPFLDAILDCNPLFLAGGKGENFTRGHTLIGAHLLGYLFRVAVSLHAPPAQALALAKYTLTLRTDALQQETERLKNRSAKRRLNELRRVREDIAANRDALDFQSFT